MAGYKDNLIFDHILSCLYKINNRYLRKIIREIIFSREGAGYYSKTLRMLLYKYHNVEIGMYSRGAFWADFPPGTKIGRYCSLAKGLIVINGSHPVSHKSTHAFFFNPTRGYVDKLLIERRTSLTIGNDVYTGTNVMILPNVKSIGTGAVVAAGSVVIKDVPPFAIVGGNPAKLIKFRFSENTIKDLLTSKWWEKDIQELKNDEKEFSSFLTKLE